jgi:putative ABC transport system substrate-binding protein
VKSRRRLAIAASGAMLALPFALRAQPRPRIGFIAAGAPDPGNPAIRAFFDGMRAQGFEEGRNLDVEMRWAGGAVAAIPGLAAELAALPVDVIVAGNNNVIAAAQQATKTVPIVMVLAWDPVRAGFVDSYARPGRNVTGLTSEADPAVIGKMLALLKQAVPAATSVGLLAQHGLNLNRTPAEQAARALGLQLRWALDVRTAEGIEPTIAALQRAGAQALFVWGGALIFVHRARVVEAEMRHRLPAMHFSAEYVRAGGLMSYGFDLMAQYRRAAWYTARILNGARPADLPVEQPARFGLAINLKTARALGLSMPQSLLLQADEVVE